MDSFDEMIELVIELTKDLVKLNKRHNPEKRIAYHEAGHAFSQLYYGIPPFLATVVPSKKAKAYIRLGYTAYKYRDHNGEIVSIDHNDDVDEYLRHTDKYFDDSIFTFHNVGLYSGTLADLLYTGTLAIEGFYGDCLDLIYRYNQFNIMGFGPNGVATYIDYTVKILRKNWKNIRLIAEDLFNQKTLRKNYFKQSLKSLPIRRIPHLEGVWDAFSL